jgi:hypothetical protein
MEEFREVKDILNIAVDEGVLVRQGQPFTIHIQLHIQSLLMIMLLIINKIY